MNYRFADCSDIDLFVQLRLDFLEVVKENKKYDVIKENCQIYFHNAITEGLCDVILAEDEGQIVGTAIVFYYQSIKITKQKGYPIIMLNASEMGKALYKKFGFSEIQNGMILNIK